MLIYNTYLCFIMQTRWNINTYIQVWQPWFSRMSLCQLATVTHTLELTHFFLPTADIIVTTNGEPVTSKEIKSCIHQIQELIVVRLNQAVANKLISSVDYLRESFVGTLERCLNSLEKYHIDSSVHNITSNHLKQVGRNLVISFILLFGFLVNNVKCEDA